MRTPTNAEEKAIEQVQNIGWGDTASKPIPLPLNLYADGSLHCPVCRAAPYLRPTGRQMGEFVEVVCPACAGVYQLNLSDDGNRLRISLEFFGRLHQMDFLEEHGPTAASLPEARTVEPKF